MYWYEYCPKHIEMPIDIVAKMLHQKDLNVTGYYSAPTPSQIS